jgi:hypothetical protein
MPKAIVVPTQTQVIGANAIVSYTCSLILPTNKAYTADYTVDTAVGIAANITAWKNKVIAEATGMGSPGMVAADVIIFGAPS